MANPMTTPINNTNTSTNTVFNDGRMRRTRPYTAVSTPHRTETTDDPRLAAVKRYKATCMAASKAHRRLHSRNETAMAARQSAYMSTYRKALVKLLAEQLVLNAL